MTIRHVLWLSLPLLLAGKCDPECEEDDTCDTGGEEDPEILDPEPTGAPTEGVDGRWSCVGDNVPPAPQGGSVELTGYVRTLADPTATAEPPAAEVQAFDTGGNLIGTGFANPGNSGRVSVTVPVPDEGFTGYLVVTETGFLEYRFDVSRPITDSSLNGWAWLTTATDRDTHASNLSLTLAAGTGVVMGSIHDCDGFGTTNVVITIEGDASGVYYVEGFDPVDTRTFTSTSGRFAIPNVAPGTVEIKAWGRLDAGGPLTLLSRVETEVAADVTSAVALEPRVGLTE